MQKLNYFQDFFKPFSSLFFPMMMTMSGVLILTIVRLVLVGDFGVDVVAGVGLANAMIGIVLIVGQGFTSAINTLFAVNKGAQRYKQITSDFQQSWYIILMLTVITAAFLVLFVFIIFFFNLPVVTKNIFAAYSLVFIFTALPLYFIWIATGILMNMGLSRLSGWIGLASTMYNTILQWFVILGICGYGGWGPYASPIGSLLALTAESIFIALVLIYHPKLKFLNLYSTLFPKLNITRLKLMIKNGLPVAGSNLGEMCLFSLAGVALVSLGTNEVAAFEITFTIIEGMLFIVLASTNSAALLVGNYIGANKVPNAKYVFNWSLITTSLTLVVIGSIIYFYRFDMARLFIKDPYTINLVAGSVAIAIVLQLFNVLNFTSNNSLRSMQDFKFAFIVNSIFFILIGTPLNFIVIHIDFGNGPIGLIGAFANIGIMILLAGLLMFRRITNYFKLPNQTLVDLVNKKLSAGDLSMTLH